MDALDEKLSAMREGGKKLAAVREELVQMVKPGITLIDIENKATKLLIATGGEPAFKRVPGYSWSTCINVNEGVVHGIPNSYVIADGDLVSIDVGLFFRGYYTDTSTSVVAGESTPELDYLLQVGRDALRASIQTAVLGKRVGDISAVMEEVLVKAGMEPMETLTGHGVGKKLHEAPYVPCILTEQVGRTAKLYEGQTLAIEAIYTSGEPEIITEEDGWTISTKDGKISGLFEETIAITLDGPEVLTTL